ncbi:hypothetical protein CYLTODRAFT_494558 [Cylindrobasidium torrendii FP15055 ss-10]|uniref:Uncharacterized protein n=1 Tax=Cylindrobasidium torrendii FP15055 ss-10 TaxID=1314674 RepID=A0A0D7AVZ2_9AGAR|nr:hypothetical protein CYLTODRAFT_494558 [Cylindrobasidium torrendii FP15055 ss-10]
MRHCFYLFPIHLSFSTARRTKTILPAQTLELYVDPSIFTDTSSPTWFKDANTIPSTLNGYIGYYIIHVLVDQRCRDSNSQRVSPVVLKPFNAGFFASGLAMMPSNAGTTGPRARRRNLGFRRQKWTNRTTWTRGRRVNSSGCSFRIVMNSLDPRARDPHEGVRCRRDTQDQHTRRDAEPSNSCNFSGAFVLTRLPRCACLSESLCALHEEQTRRVYLIVRDLFCAGFLAFWTAIGCRERPSRAAADEARGRPEPADGRHRDVGGRWEGDNAENELVRPVGIQLLLDPSTFLMPPCSSYSESRAKESMPLNKILEGSAGTIAHGAFRTAWNYWYKCGGRLSFSEVATTKRCEFVDELLDIIVAIICGGMSMIDHGNQFDGREFNGVRLMYVPPS